jgi:hypothetical protein
MSHPRLTTRHRGLTPVAEYYRVYDYLLGECFL